MTDELYFSNEYMLTRGNHTNPRAIERINELPEEIREHVETNDPCWSYVNPGWVQLVVDLHNELVKIAPDYRISQIKEKFGGLRFYTNVHDEAGRNIISRYEQMSEMICDVCGKLGKRQNIGGWIATRCDKHNKG